ncbi:hypothetical protein [Endozoicomonas elysicola]|uniref:Uncharacterized protein n=1 Tax=Endozoicomonas elysicola TaxID=305900 RepID=A0A081KBX1_9GAMM|nr:hypothetical protein [Endozoicomonas elysicola]KEI71647.1 hypothetical protein GV64_13675 [Endozoicomonas elysicola]
METLSNAASTVASFLYKAVTLPVRIGCFFIGKMVKAVSNVYNYLTGNSGQTTQKQSPSTPIDNRQVTAAMPGQAIPASMPATIAQTSFSAPPRTAPASINYQLLGSGRSGFSPIYDRVSQPGDLPLGSVNAGDPFKYVGGKGINKGHADALGIQKGSQDDLEFINFHDQFMKGVRREQLVHAIPATRLGIFPSKLQAATVLYDCLATHPKGHPKYQISDGTVFVEEFTDSACPHGNLNNRIMLYIIPPNRVDYPDDQSFCHAVEKMAINTVRAFEEHNLWRIRNGLAPVPVLRLCAFSSSIFAQRPGQPASSVDVRQVLAHIQNGLHHQLAQTSTIKTVQYSNVMQPIVPQVVSPGNLQGGG